MFAVRRLSPRIAIAIPFLLRGILQGSWYPRIPGVVANTGVDPKNLGLIFFMLALGTILALNLAARITARIGTARTHAAFALPLPFIVMIVSQTSGLTSFALGMFLFGFSVGGYDLSTSVQGAIVERRTRTPYISALYGLFSVGALLGSLSSGLLANAHVPIMWQFGTIALFTIPLTWMTTVSMLPDDAKPVPAARRRRLPGLPPKILLPLGLTIVCIAIGEETVNNWVALYMKDQLHTSVAVAGFAYTAFSVTTATGRLLGDVVIRHIGVDRTLVSGAILAAIGMGGGMAINQPAAIIFGYGLVGLGLSVVVPVTYRRANDIPGMQPAAAVAAVASIGFVGFLIGPLIIGGLANLFSLRVAIATVAVILLGIVLLTLKNPSRQGGIADSIDV